MSPRAAWRLETHGFRQVFNYGAGKVDWLASGLPTEGKEARVLRAKDCVRRNFPTCRLTDRVRDVQHRVQAAGREGCVVLNGAGVVLGYLSSDRLEAAFETSVEQVMEPGPATIRADVSLPEISEYLRKRNIDRILVTTPDGECLGILYGQDAEQMLH